MRLDHVAVGVRDLRTAAQIFIDLMGGEPLIDRGANETEGFEWMTFRLGGAKIELVAPHGGTKGAVRRYIEKYGEGLHHISVSVRNIEHAVAYFESRGIRLLGLNVEDPEFKHCYLHPADTCGVLIQVFEESARTLRNSS